MMNSSSDLMGLRSSPRTSGGYIAEKTFNNSITSSDEFRMLEHFGAEASVLDMRLLFVQIRVKPLFLKSFYMVTRETRIS